MTGQQSDDLRKIAHEYETKAYLKEKKQITEKIHEHWKLEVDVFNNDNRIFFIIIFSYFAHLY